MRGCVETDSKVYGPAGAASAKDMLTLVADVRERVHKAFAVELEHEVVVWNA